LFSFIPITQASTFTWERSVPDPYGILHGSSNTELALNSNGNPYISYYSGPGATYIKLARGTGSSWTLEPVDQIGSFGIYSSIALDSNGNPCISYTDESITDDVNRPNYYLKFARWSGSSWIIETVDLTAGIRPSLAFDLNGNPHISYGEVYNKDLKYAKWTGSGCHTR